MRSIIYIDRNNLYFYGSNVHAPLLLPFQPTTVRDIEVINAEELEKQLNEFIKNNKIEPTEAMIIIAHQSSFEKLIDAKTPPDQTEEQKKQFLENVPFEQTLSQTFTTAKGMKIIAVNRDLLYLIKNIFTKNNFVIDIMASIATVYPEGDITFNATSAQQLLNKASQIKQHAFSLQDEDKPAIDSFEETYGKEKKNQTLYYLIPVFIVLIAILAWLVMRQRTTSRNTNTRISTTPASTSTPPTVTIMPTGATASESAIIIPKNTVRIRVLNGSGIVGQADTVRALLVDDGYTNISTGNAPTLQSARTLIVFKSRIPSSQQQQIVTLISEIIGGVTTQINEEIDVDVLITTSSDNP